MQTPSEEYAKDVFNQSSSLTGIKDASGQTTAGDHFQTIIVVQYCVFGTLVNIFGIVTNIINIIVFIKQGFKESINISLIALAISDMCSLIALQWANICFSPIFQSKDVSFVPLDVAYLTAGWPRMTFTHITGWITAFITLERCICIAIPLKVKMILTPTRTVTIISVIYIVMIGSVVPTYYTSRLAWRFVHERNKTLLALTFTEDREEVDAVVFAISNATLPTMAFIIVVACTVFLIYKLKLKSKWRQISSNMAEHSSTKDTQIIKMVGFISTIFILCFLPTAAVSLIMVCEPEFNIDGKYGDIIIMVGGLCYFLESINSSINIFLYLKMSTKFRDAFYRIFHAMK